MSAFGDYAGWYDLFYADKDYFAEAGYVDVMIRKAGITGSDLLEIGCGTGGHAEALVGKGWHVTGVDVSEGMLSRARNRFNAMPQDMKERGKFIQGDARNFKLGFQFDAVVSLFHVMSYQSGKDELLLAMETARKHLKSGGVFVFDFWYGPAVLMQLPEHRLRRVESDGFIVHRFVTPRLFENEDVVDVHYAFVVTDKRKNLVEEVHETHRMRYLFLPELSVLAKISGFEEVTVMEWMSGEAPSRQSWNVCAMLR